MNLRDEFEMRVTNYDDGVLDIEMPKEDYEKIIAILDQITEISYLSIENGMYHDLPELTAARFNELDAQMRSVEQSPEGSNSEKVTVKLTEYSTYLLDAILQGAASLDDENFKIGNGYISEEAIIDLHDRFSLITAGLRPEKERAFLGRSHGAEIPRFKYE